jgi:tetratricopeptide (TPR) repeat protein
MRFGKSGIWVLAAALAMGVALPASAQSEPPAVRVGSFAGGYLAGRTAEIDNDLPSAVAYYRRALAFDAGNTELQQSLLLSLIAMGEFDDALQYADALKEVPESERFSRLALAVDAMRKGDFTQAEFFLKIALQSDLDRLLTGTLGAWAKAGAGEEAEALAAIEALAGPEWVSLFKNYHIGLIAELAGDDAKARESYAAVVANMPAGAAAPEVYLRAAEANARFLARQGEREAAIEALDAVEEFVANRVEIAALREAIEAGDEIEPLVTDASAGASEILLNLATALNRGGGEAFVRLYLNYALALTPDSDAVLVQLGAVAEQQRQSEQAIAYFAQIPDGSPFKRLAELQQGLNLADLERYEEAEEHLANVLELAPDDFRAYLALGGVYSAQEKYREAADLYDRAVARIDEPAREHWNIYYQRGIAYERLKEWPKAEPNFKQALELFPDQPQVLNYLGYSWVDMNMNLDEGLDLIKRAVELRPSDGYIVDSLGWAYYRLGRYEEAVTELERAVGLMPSDPILNDHLGDAYWRVGRKLEASFQWSHAKSLDPEADLLAQVEEKLRDGLPAEDERAEAAGEEPATVDTASLDDAAMVAAAAPAPAEVANPSVYVVRPGQSLWSIATEAFGDGNRYVDILEANPSLRGDPGRIVPGQELVLPAN